MKRKLTKEQSARLIELGVSADKASERELDYKDTQKSGLPLEFRRTIPIFTLVDVLELLPKAILTETMFGEKKLCNLTIDCVGMYWVVGYMAVSIPALSCSTQELIDSLYGLLCWAIENNFMEQ